MTTDAATTRAWIQPAYGGPEILEQRTIDRPRPGKGEVLVRVRATSLNSADAKLLRGEPGVLRLGFGLRRPRNPVRGMDVAGTIVAVGEGVDGSHVGDEVVGEISGGGGGLATYAVTRFGRVVPRPADVDPATAAAVPLAGGTAWHALRLAGVRAGSRVLVIGASGGVGSFAVQLAARSGAEVWALCGERNRALVERLGATRTFDYRATGPETLPEGTFDAVIDIGGTAPLGVLQRLVREGGSVVMVAGEGKGPFGPIGRMLRAVFRSIGSKRRLRPLAARASASVTSMLLEKVARGELEPVIERTFAFDEARDALAHVDAGHTVGKVVVRVED
ncbi:NAD(P)-dependent alcohol dehydrogenase [Microbacterium immunditiarum]|uniref:NADPH:quinone reductase-like Zn-dependent oxidoreductase n=1 Tax=Microbacterium immunditiarum TaxID=337480 RepID=A0A7Y9GLV0_9MICO|nr:NAD(P)-dependent alcohol dehydrogenase [Microbacterium immunditiarum]NYE18856.1 NADPH:quinone reductase-like Zn-dependent oxidoreductase [Microbacterium immunditiarum]